MPTDDSNLAIRAARAVAGLLPDPGRVGVRLHIAKEIPVAGGMAGGSADAAGAARLRGAWGVDASADDLVGLASGLGADVPFCLVGNTALGTGRGDVVTPVLTRGTYHWVVALVDYELSTPAVFARFDELSPDAPDPVPPEMLMGALAGGGADELGRHLENDLQPAAVALRPSLQALLDEGIDSGAVGALLSGSGPTCLFLARDADHATRIAVNLAASGLCRDVRVASGPVPGASVV